MLSYAGLVQEQLVQQGQSSRPVPHYTLNLQDQVHPLSMRRQLTGGPAASGTTGEAEAWLQSVETVGSLGRNDSDVSAAAQDDSDAHGDDDDDSDTLASDDER